MIDKCNSCAENAKFFIFSVLLWVENPTTYMRGIFHYFPKLEIKQAFDGYYR